MTFGQFIRYRRERILDKERPEIDFGNSYLASIETEERRPQKQSVITRLGIALGILEPIALEWLWYYSFANKEPYPFPMMYRKPIITKADLPVIFSENTSIKNGSQPQTSQDYISKDTNIAIEINSTETDVLASLGNPDKKISVPSRCKWIYAQERLHVIFSEGKVTDVTFT